MMTEEINFVSKLNNCDIKTYKECLDKYTNNFEKVLKLETDFPIFLDTNVLLRYYSISFTAREKLFDFIDKNKHRIIITNQVQKEFLKNREDVIKKYFEQVTNKIPKDFSSDIVNKLKSFIEQHKIILKDYPYVETGIMKHKEELEQILIQLNKDSEDKYSEFKNLIWKDKFLDLLCECKQINNLNQQEIILIKSKFDNLKNDIKPSNIENILNTTKSIFPGLCDIKEKPENPYGDFIIYHEIMKYMIQEECESIFLTFDNSKGDWMSKNKTAYIHYVENMYLNTNHIIYILDAERTLEKILNVDIDSLINLINVEQSDITVISINAILKTHYIFRNTEFSGATKHIVTELLVNNYKHNSEIIRDLDKISEIMEVFKKENPNYSSLGFFRFALRIVNPNYRKIVRRDGSIENNPEHFYTKIEKYINMLNSFS